MKKIISLCLLIISTGAFAQTTGTLTIAAYNVKDLFDTLDDPAKNDNEYLPDAVTKFKWNTRTFNIKIRNIARVITSIDSCGCPALLGLVEVENKKVVEYLLTADTLKKCNYGIVHYETIDPRGIDNVFIYDKNVFNLISEKNFVMNTQMNGHPYSHDFLYSSFATGADTLHVFLNHLKARSKYQKDTSTYKRALQAAYQKTLVDSMMKLNKNAKILVMGDFNDNPDDSSIVKVLNAFPEPPGIPFYLMNPFYSIFKNGAGTYKFGDTWHLFDQIILSSGLNDAATGIKYISGSAAIFDADWLYYYDKKTGNKKPNLQYSDHFPVYLKLEMKN